MATQSSPPPDWQCAAIYLFGADWIAPTAELLGVSRRTVERYRNGLSPVPQAVDRILNSRLPDEIPHPVYGALLRKVASGLSLTEIRNDIELEMRALEIFRDQIDEGNLLARRAMVSGMRPE